jgi:hypothetical protein
MEMSLFQSQPGPFDPIGFDETCQLKTSNNDLTQAEIFKKRYNRCCDIRTSVNNDLFYLDQYERVGVCSNDNSNDANIETFADPADPSNKAPAALHGTLYKQEGPKLSPTLPKQQPKETPKQQPKETPKQQPKEPKEARKMDKGKKRKKQKYNDDYDQYYDYDLSYFPYYFPQPFPDYVPYDIPPTYPPISSIPPQVPQVQAVSIQATQQKANPAIDDFTLYFMMIGLVFILIMAYYLLR